MSSSSTATSSPRPCLKHAQQPNVPLHSSSHVHFPPTPSLSTTFPTHSKKTYDRRPLVVAPNSCALPARGCPGRTYPPGVYRRPESADVYADMDINLDDLLFASRSSSTTVTPTTSPPPSLIPDQAHSSSESDESDVLASPYGASAVRDSQMGEQEINFLPHPPSQDERVREREIRWRRRRERAEEEGRWKTGNIIFKSDEESCFGGF